MNDFCQKEFFKDKFTKNFRFLQEIQKINYQFYLIKDYWIINNYSINKFQQN